MNCDQAFDCLTDPQRRDASELMRHLAGCPRCRTMRDTLEPALDLFGELVAEPDVSDYVRTARTGASTESLQLAEQTAARLVAGDRNTGRSASSWRMGLRYAAAMLLGAGIALAVQSPVDQPAAVVPVERSVCFWKDRTAMDGLEQTSDALTLTCMKCHFTYGDVGAAVWNGRAGHGLSERHNETHLNCIACHLPASTGL